MKISIVCRVEKDDTFLPPTSPGDAKPVVVPLLDNATPERVISAKVLDVLKRFSKYPTDTALDLINVSIVVYAADKLNLRKMAFDGWSRYFVLYLPVINPELWNLAKDELESMLSFLSGDKWDIEFRRRNRTTRELFEEKELLAKRKVESVCLCSGGLDSFIGALDLLESVRKTEKAVALVSVYESADSHMPQERAVERLKEEYTADAIEHYSFYVGAKGKGEKEPTTRSRSFMFLSFGVGVASSCGAKVPLYVPENGLISLNIPLTYARMGSLSTRTTHPYFIFLFNQLLAKLEISNVISNPYRFMTKGEMIARSSNIDFINKYADITMSCSHPSQGRWTKEGVHKHCGYCVPCIIRRAAMYSNKIKDNNYRQISLKKLSPEIKKGMDIRAFRMALSPEEGKLSPLLKILGSGPIPGSEKERREYAAVYERGMREVEYFLKSQ